jgi:hypothetical protein
MDLYLRFDHRVTREHGKSCNIDILSSHMAIMAINEYLGSAAGLNRKITIDEDSLPMKN